MRIDNINLAVAIVTSTGLSTEISKLVGILDQNSTSAVVVLGGEVGQ